MTRPLPRDPTAPQRPSEPSPRKAWIVSAAVHAAIVAAILVYGLFKPKTVATATMELVAGDESASLRPLAPRAPEPPPEPEPAPEPEPEPEAPALVSKPKDAKTPPKPEPKKPTPRDTVAKATKPSPAAPATSSSASQQGSEGGVQVSGASGSPTGQSRWIARVRQQIHPLWKPPSGIEVAFPDTIAVRFKVEVETGEISEITLVKSSASSILNEETLRAVKRRDRVVPPKNLVPEASEDYWQVRYEFVYKGF